MSDILERMFNECGVRVKFVDVTRLSKHDVQILEKLAEDGGFTTKQVGRYADCYTCDGRKHSADVRQRILSLVRRGLVTTLDDQKPVCWLRTPSGTKALNATKGSGGL